MSRLSDDDRNFGPLTWARSTGWKPLRLVLSSGGDNDYGATENSLTGYAFGWILRLKLPNLLRPYRDRYGVHAREYGFHLNEGFLQLFFGPQTGDSLTTKDWCKHLPWTQWRFVRRSLYGLQGEHFWTEPTGRQVPGGAAWDEQERQREAVPKATFAIEDYDGARINVTTYVEEREWRFGEGWFKWLSWFRKPKVTRSLDLRFAQEVGPDKGSWKGGLIGHSIEMLPGELHESAVKRYCELEHRARESHNYRIKFLGAVTEEATA